MKKQNIFLGIILAFLGSLVGALPWLLLYLFGNMIIFVGPLLICFGAIFGYNLAMNDDNILDKIIVSIIILITFSLCIFVITPFFINLKYNNGVLSLANFYANDANVSNLYRLLGYSLIGLAIGIISVFSSKSGNLKTNSQKYNDDISGSSKIKAIIVLIFIIIVCVVPIVKMTKVNNTPINNQKDLFNYITYTKPSNYTEYQKVDNNNYVYYINEFIDIDSSIGVIKYENNYKSFDNLKNVIDNFYKEKNYVIDDFKILTTPYNYKVLYYSYTRQSFIINDYYIYISDDNPIIFVYAEKSPSNDNDILKKTNDIVQSVKYIGGIL